MIVSTKGKKAKQAVKGSYGKGFSPDLIARTRTLLANRNAATHLDDLRIPPGNRIEALGRDRKGQHSLRINDQWRICFTWTDEGPAEVEITNYH